MSDEVTRLLVIRHGETAWNAEHRVQGQLDAPLNAIGEAQAQAVAKVLSRALEGQAGQAARPLPDFESETPAPAGRPR